MKIFDYDIKKYPFRDLASGLYDKDLSELDSDDTKLDLTLGKDTATPFHKLFYERIDSGYDIDFYKAQFKDKSLDKEIEDTKFLGGK